MHPNSLKSAIFSSDRQDWGTPPQFVDWIEHELGVEFTLDAAASEENAKAPLWFDEEMNGLKQPWGNMGVVWVNPPFGRELKDWVLKASQEAGNARIFMLIPCRPDTQYFHELIMKKAANIYLIKGRMNFIMSDTGTAKGNAPFPSMLVEFDNMGKYSFNNNPCQIDAPKFKTLEPSAQVRGWS